MDYIKEVNINEAIIHILDNNSQEPILNEYKINLSDEVYNFILKHIERCLKDEELKYAIFKEERNIVKELSQEYLSGQNDIIDVSKEIARQLFVLMESQGNIPSCDLIVTSISTEYGNMLGILKMDYVKNYSHNINSLEDKIGIEIVQEITGLPTSSQKIQKCAFIKLEEEGSEYDLLVIDKQKKKDSEDYGANYFINKLLGCKIVENSRDETKNFVTASENWTRVNLKENAEEAEKVRSTIKKKLKEEESLDLYEVSQELFGDNKEAKASFVDYAYSEGVNDKINLDKHWIEKKLKRTRLKIDRDIDLYINEEAYSDVNRFQVKRNGDGSIDIVIKNVINYIEK
ncbi:nucleoid-associated protein [Clostridium tetani]|uniref:Nucleoid-associated protein n=1 Tax=Clostridium tetani TaxID=1513 RepID=A0A4Q0VCG5_CLOTA|nr:nucleoid-associated protein [Clostridium tetani]AVP54877.1 nucleoid-associated protein [Clostridium tetani]RXI48579.1 nucleoid-associated protein [Clostridium tetani]RXI75917.1 nucleoid-associated protein [Clostridium tetani]WFN62197.1 nucleoid-associated protein [Clostridium tetani]SUY54370.1 nucleoid-associated protein [Clostridium tetani]